MANDRVERQLERLKTLRSEGRSDAALKDLRKALNDRVNLVVAKAAEIGAEWHAQTLTSDFREAFLRLLNAPETDPQCWGKNALAKALKDVGCAESDVFLSGLRCHQFESVWGGKTDTACVLRGTCALALVQCTDITRHEILRHLVDAVTEPDTGAGTNARVRADAARALEQMGGREVELLLRLKARAGDSEVRVTGQVFESILQLEGPHAVPFVAGFLSSTNEEVSEEAALALGASRMPESVDALMREWSKTKAKHNGAILLRAISASRQDSALDFLVDQIRKAQWPVAVEALHALELHRESEEIVKRVEAAVADRDGLETIFRENFSVR